jgi:hypothetical protein
MDHDLFPAIGHGTATHTPTGLNRRGRATAPRPDFPELCAQMAVGAAVFAHTSECARSMNVTVFEECCWHRTLRARLRRGPAGVTAVS